MEKIKEQANFTEYFDLINIIIDNDIFSYLDIEDQEIINSIKSRFENLPIIITRKTQSIMQRYA